MPNTENPYQKGFSKQCHYSKRSACGENANALSKSTFMGLGYPDSWTHRSCITAHNLLLTLQEVQKLHACSCQVFESSNIMILRCSARVCCIPERWRYGAPQDALLLNCAGILNPINCPSLIFPSIDAHLNVCFDQSEVPLEVLLALFGLS